MATITAIQCQQFSGQWTLLSRHCGSVVNTHCVAEDRFYCEQPGSQSNLVSGMTIRFREWANSHTLTRGLGTRSVGARTFGGHGATVPQLATGLIMIQSLQVVMAAKISQPQPLRTVHTYAAAALCIAAHCCLRRQLRCALVRCVRIHWKWQSFVWTALESPS